ncbi:hypothetical protein BJV74DRAFT_882540 [Russula compacta]|nr:hypothetical protein BJV74DRAFT_882540 [Russula compacta]
MNNIRYCPQLPQPASYFASSRLFFVPEFSPRTGCSGTVMNVNIWCCKPKTSNFGIRIVIGFEPVLTCVHHAEARSAELWSCIATAIVPEFEVHKNLRTHTVNVSIEAVYGNVVCDSLTFGYFTYRPPMQRRILRRHESDQPFEKVTLEFVKDPAQLNLTGEEKRGRRKLVKCIREQYGDTLRLSFRTIRQEDYDKEPQSAVISCIYRTDTEPHPTTWFTSVDMIRLVEYIVQDQFNADEKSRIRRNLESLAPITISKSTKETKAFFEVLMNFSTPMPRVIEKDIKVFKWADLAHGLKKIMEKYSWFTVPEEQSSTAPSPLSAKSSTLLVHNTHGNAPPPYSLTAFVPSADTSYSASSNWRQDNPVATTVDPSSLLLPQNSMIESPAAGDNNQIPAYEPPFQV